MPMSQEERDLMELQTQLLQQSVDATNSGNELNKILLPILLEQQGYTVNRATKNVVNPAYTKLEKRNEFLTAQLNKNVQYFAKDNSGEFRLSKLGRGDMNRDRRVGNEKLIAELNSVRSKLRTTDRYSQRVGDISGLEQVADPSRDLRKQNEQLLLERQNAALRGELPVSPALLSDLSDQETQLRESLLQNLGTGFETSTPGIEALAKFNEHKNAILEATRRDDIAGAGQQANMMGGFLDSLANSRFGRATTAGQLPFMGSNNLLSIANSANGPMNFMLNNRSLDAQIAAQNNGPGVLESALALGVGAMTGGVGMGLASLFLGKE